MAGTPQIYGSWSGSGKGWGSKPGRVGIPDGEMPDSNPFKTVSNVRIPEVDSRLKDLFKEFDALKTSTNTGLDAYTAAVEEANPAVKGFAEQDTGYLSRLLSGGADSDLAGIRDRRSKAMGLTVAQAQKDLRNTLGLASAGVVGGSVAPGMGSYLSRLGLDQLTRINTQAAKDAADQERADYAYTMQQKAAAIGQRTPILSALAQRNLLPGAVQGDQLAQLLAQIQQLIGAKTGSNFYGLANSLDGMGT